MTERNKLPAIRATDDVVTPAEHSASLVARGLEAIRSGSRQELSLLSEEELEELFRKYCELHDYENALRILGFLEGRGSGSVDELCGELVMEAQPSCVSFGDEDDDAGEIARAESCRNCITKAAERGFALAQDMLGELYCFGTWAEEGSSEDNAEAVKWSRKAAEQGKRASQENLALMYYLGKKGLPQDYVQAMKWFEKAAEQNSLSAQFKIGEMYYKGEGVPQDYAEALKWYRKIVERIDESDDYGMATDVSYRIAEMYYRGEGVTKDYVQAYMWLALLLKQSRFASKATDLSKEIASKITPAQIAEAQRLAREWTERHAS